MRVVLAALVLLAGLVAACDGGGVVTNPYQCIGMPVAMCERMVADAQRDLPGVVVVGATIRCTSGVCTEQRGEAEVRIDFSNGEHVSYGTGWENAAPGGPAPGVPEPVPVPDPVEPVAPSPAAS